MNKKEKLNLRRELYDARLSMLLPEDGEINKNIPTAPEYSRFHGIDFISKRIIKENIDGDVVEAGCWMGGTAIYLSKLLPKKKIWLLDSFDGIEPKETRKYQYEKTEHNGGEHKASYEDCMNALKRYEVAHRCEVLKGWFKDTLKHVPGPISFLRIDSDTYSGTKEVLDELYEKVVPNGFIKIDDSVIEEVRVALWEWFDENYHLNLWKSHKVLPFNFRAAYADCSPLGWDKYEPGKHWGVWWRKVDLGERKR